jgi:hypothetical protein
MSGGQMGGDRPRRGRLSPLLAAAAVVVVVGASAGIAVALSSHTSKAPSAGGGGIAASATSQPASDSSGPTQSASSVSSSVPVSSAAPVTNGPLVYSGLAPVALSAGSLAGGGNALYAFSTDNLLEIDPSSGHTTHQAPSNGFPGQAPVIAGNKVWEVATYGGSVGLNGYTMATLAADGSITVPVSGAGSGNPDGILTAGPDGNLYLAAGSAVDELNPSSGSVIRQFPVPGGTANSVAVSPDGSRIYVGVGGASYRIVELNRSTGAVVASGSEGANESGGALLATSGGVWFTNNGRVWFAPASDLSGARLIAGPAGGGDEAIPTYANGAVWVGGTKKLACLDPATGQVRASFLVPTSEQAPGGIGDITSAAGHVFALYVDTRTAMAGQVTGVDVLSPSAACTSGGTSSGGAGS